MKNKIIILSMMTVLVVTTLVLLGKLMTAESECEIKDSEIADLRKAIETQALDNEELFTENRELESNCADYKVSVIQLEEKISNLTAANKGYSVEFQNMTTELSDAYDTIDSLNKEIERLNGELEKEPAVKNLNYKYTKSEIKELYRCVQAEAGELNYDAAKLITAVIINRVKSSGFPNSIHDVIYQPGQFEVVTNGSINKEVKDQKMIDAVNEVLLTGTELPSNVLFFYSDSAVRQDHWIRTLKVHSIVQDTVFAYEN